MNQGNNSAITNDSKWTSPRLIQLGHAANSRGGSYPGAAESSSTVPDGYGGTITYFFYPFSG